MFRNCNKCVHKDSNELFCVSCMDMTSNADYFVAKPEEEEKEEKGEVKTYTCAGCVHEFDFEDNQKKLSGPCFDCFIWSLPESERNNYEPRTMGHETIEVTTKVDDGFNPMPDVINNPTEEEDTFDSLPPFHAILNEMRELLDRKNKDYAGSDQADPFRNFRYCEEFGIDPVDGLLTRLSDKWMRLTNLKRTGMCFVMDESFEDTLLDLANYTVITLAFLREQRKKDEG